MSDKTFWAQLECDIDEQIEESAEMGEPPSFVLRRDQADALLDLLRAADGMALHLKGKKSPPEEECSRTIPLAPYMAIPVLLNHIEPGWENCKEAVAQWYAKLQRPPIPKTEKP